jgi:hypothetical protein
MQGDLTMQEPTSNMLLMIGLALNTLGTAFIFMFAYPPEGEQRRKFFIGLTRVALVLMFSGFLIQLLAAYHRAP